MCTLVQLVIHQFSICFYCIKVVMSLKSTTEYEFITLTAILNMMYRYVIIVQRLCLSTVYF